MRRTRWGYIAGCLSGTGWARRFGIRVVFVTTLGVSALMLVLASVVVLIGVLPVLVWSGPIAAVVSGIVFAARSRRARPPLR
jgi:hypothetical protein